MAVNTPHNNFFINYFSNTDNLKELIKFLLPEELRKKLDFNSLDIIKDSFVNTDLKEYYSDLIANCKLNGKDIYVYILFEHKSSPEKYIELQLLKYMLSLWEKDIEGGLELRPIIPIVFYHGQSEWKVFSIEGYVSRVDDKLIDYVPKFRYILGDIGRIEDEKVIDSVIESKAVQSAILLMKHIFDGEVDLEGALREIFYNVKELFKTKEGVEIIKTFLIYLFNSTEVKPERLKLTLKEVERGEEVFMSTADVLIKQGIEKGVQQGLKMGKHEKAIETAKRMIEKGFDVNIIVDVTGLTMEEVKRLREELG